MFNLWRKKYEKNLDMYREFLENNTDYIRFYQNRITEIVNSTPYKAMDYNVEFNLYKDLKIEFYMDKYRAIVRVSADKFGHYPSITNKMSELCKNVIDSYKRTLFQAICMGKNEYEQELEDLYKVYSMKLGAFLGNINEEMQSFRKSQ